MRTKEIHTALLRNTKVGYFAYTVQIKQEIISFEILLSEKGTSAQYPMKSASFVKICKTIESLSDQRSNNLLLESSVFLETASYTSTWNILQKDAERGDGSFVAKILNDIFVIEVFQCFNFRIQGIDHALGPFFISIIEGPRDLDLFDSKHFSRRGVQTKVYGAICSLPDQFTLDPFERP
jgi:hypothetical protein